MSLSIDEINKLKEENARLKREYDILDGIIDLNNAKIGQLQKENERLKEENFNFEEIVKLCRCEQYEQTLQEIKAIAENLLEKGLEPQSVELQLRLKGKRELASIILDLITKAERESE